MPQGPAAPSRVNADSLQHHHELGCSVTNEGGVSFLPLALVGAMDAPGSHPARLDWRASIDVRYCSTKFRSACDVPTGTSQACPDMNEAANQGGLEMTGARGGAERCRTTLQHQEFATFTSDLYKSRDICGSFLHLVRPTRPC
jgi:hypothetical protein